MDSSAEDFDRLIASSPNTDHFCSSTAWIIPAHHALMPPREPWIYRGSSGWVALARGNDPSVGHYLQPLEAMWEFASPLAMGDQKALLQDFVSAILRDRESWNLPIVGGLVRGSLTFSLLAYLFDKHFRVGVSSQTYRHVAALDGGIDGFLSRRSARFRANLRRAARQANSAGVSYDYHCEAMSATKALTIYDRVLKLERESWKGRKQRGIDSGGMCEFYSRMIGRIAPAGAFRCLFATLDGQDIGYVFGGVLNGVYRGLQVTYHHDFAALAPGNLVQLEMIRRLSLEGLRSYDLGSEMAYKHRWAEANLTTVSLVIAR